MAAAGSGERLGAGGPKAFVPVGGKPMVQWSLDAFAAAGSVGAIVVATPQGGAGDIDGDHVTTVPGGSTRSESVNAAMAAVETEVVVVHDAARPLVTPELIEAVVADLLADDECKGVVAATPVTDTVKQTSRDREVAGTLDRSSLWAAQTPQAFRTEALREALDSTTLLAQATDDAMLLERLGLKVLLHEAPPENIKVTTPLDLRIAEMLLAARA